MTSWNVNILGKGIRKASVENFAKKLKKEFGSDSEISVRDSTPPVRRVKC